MLIRRLVFFPIILLINFGSIPVAGLLKSMSFLPIFEFFFMVIIAVTLRLASILFFLSRQGFDYVLVQD